MELENGWELRVGVTVEELLNFEGEPWDGRKGFELLPFHRVHGFLEPVVT